MSGKYEMTTDALSLTFTALADPTRRAILARLALGEATVNELAAPFALQLPAISKHLKTLERAGLVSKGRQAQWRPCRLEAAPLKEVADYVMDFRRFWEERYERLDEYLEELQAQRASTKAAPRTKQSTRTQHTKEKGHGRGK
jgi:DNA-binding transcriptional ArsR family regulator